MAVIVVTGSSGLIGSESVKFFHSQGYDVVGIDNGMRQYFFGADGSVRENTKWLLNNLRNFRHYDVDIRDSSAIGKIFDEYSNDIACIIHTAAQPSHDWAAKEPVTDFTVNALGTLHLLEFTRKFCPTASFIFTSTNKVYGDTPNRLPLIELSTRWECDPQSVYAKYGIDENMSIDQSKHSVFGASKVAADVMVQEYGRYFGLKTGVFRGGCLTGPAHSGAELHGFLAYLVRCNLEGRAYTIFGHKGKQVRDNIHSADLVNAFWHFHRNPRSGEVYNIGGSRHSSCSILEAIAIVEEMTGREMRFTLSDQARAGDHIWWISDVSKFQSHYPEWGYKYDLRTILREIVDQKSERQTSSLAEIDSSNLH